MAACAVGVGVVVWVNMLRSKWAAPPPPVPAAHSLLVPRLSQSSCLAQGSLTGDSSVFSSPQQKVPACLPACLSWTIVCHLIWSELVQRFSYFFQQNRKTNVQTGGGSVSHRASEILRVNYWLIVSTVCNHSVLTGCLVLTSSSLHFQSVCQLPHLRY